MLYQQYLPVFMQLVNILLIKVRMPPDDEYSSWNDGRCHVSLMCDVLVILV